MVPVVLTIGGSDSCGGAGIQADLKTFSALGTHGATVLTAITAQNTLGVSAVFGLDPRVVASQIDAIFDDFNISCAKTGMLYSTEIISVVAERIRDARVPLVVDPVMTAEAGGVLLLPEAIAAICDELIPLARVVTPNIFEAGALTGIDVVDLKSAGFAASAISDMGASAVIITGGHLSYTDLLFEGGETHLIAGDRAEGGTHGVGCTYSAALTSFLARDLLLRDAASLAKQFAAESIARSCNLGRGVSPVNQIASVLDDAERFRVLLDLGKALSLLEDEPTFWSLIPEVGSNIGMAILNAREIGDVAAVEGRLVKSGNKVHKAGCPQFGASSHIARVILAAMKFDPRMRAAMNIRVSEPIIEICEDLGLKVGSFDRKDEPLGKDTMSWGTVRAIGDAGFVPDVIWDSGGMGKEPMIRLLGVTATSVADRAVRIARLHSGGE